jgi:hypothetical protein
VKAAGQNAVHAPLSPAARKLFNESRAIEWLNQQLGLDYGFKNLLFGWLDTVSKPTTSQQQLLSLPRRCGMTFRLLAMCIS